MINLSLSCYFFIIVAFGMSATAQTSDVIDAKAEQMMQPLSICELSKGQDTWHGKEVKVEANIRSTRHGIFLTDRKCKSVVMLLRLSCDSLLIEDCPDVLEASRPANYRRKNGQKEGRFILTGIFESEKHSSTPLSRQSTLKFLFTARRVTLPPKTVRDG